MIEKEESVVEKIDKFFTRFFGSWWAVVFHTLWIAIWLTFHFNLEILTLGISLEAIFIWVVYLTASNRREEQRDKLGALQQIKIKEKMLDNLANGEKHNEKLDHITKMLYELEEEVKAIKSRVK